MRAGARRLDWLLASSAARAPDAPAVRVPGREVTYRELDDMANQAAAALAQAGVGRGDRVGLWLDKSVATVAAMQGALRLGAPYVPVDPDSPPRRAASILSGCQAALIVTTEDRAASLRDTAAEGIRCLSVQGADDGLRFAGVGPLPSVRWTSEGSPDELAYILHTSGSTGSPKGVCVSHGAAMAFVDWGVGLIQPCPDDRFSNHAPFHFDLSVFDLFVAFSAGSCVCIVPGASSFAARQLVDFLVAERITIWYSVPSALMLMIEHGGLLDVDPLRLRHLLFAGEAFPLRYVRKLRERWPRLPLHNLYGPTETNVCTALTVSQIEPDRVRPLPIGKAACGDRVWAVTDDGREAAIGEEGELCVTGPTVMLGYWGDAPQGDRPYRTGDLVRRLDEENYDFLGRRDHMLKIRGYRVEAGEVESCLLTCPGVREAAVVVGGEGLNARLVAFLVGEDGVGKPPSLIALKQHCSARLPRTMIIHSVRWVQDMPRTGNGKIDRLLLQRWTAEDKEAQVQ